VANEGRRAVDGIDPFIAPAVAEGQRDFGRRRFRRELAVATVPLRASESGLVDEPEHQLARAARILSHALGVVDDQSEQLLVESTVLQLARGDQLAECVATRAAVREQRAQSLDFVFEHSDLLAQASELVVARFGPHRFVHARDDRRDERVHARRRRRRRIEPRELVDCGCARTIEPFGPMRRRRVGDERGATSVAHRHDPDAGDRADQQQRHRPDDFTYPHRCTPCPS
jgi:hypothetical protein